MADLPDRTPPHRRLTMRQIARINYEISGGVSRLVDAAALADVHGQAYGHHLSDGGQFVELVGSDYRQSAILLRGIVLRVPFASYNIDTALVAARIHLRAGGALIKPFDPSDERRMMADLLAGDLGEYEVAAWLVKYQLWTG